MRGYDALSRLTSIATPDNTIGYTYDAAGNRITAVDGAQGLDLSSCIPMSTVMAQKAEAGPNGFRR